LTKSAYERHSCQGCMSFLDDGHFGYIKTSLFISLCIFRDLPSRRSPGTYAGDGATFLCSHGTIF
jgi:hypothetical protein